MLKLQQVTAPRDQQRIFVEFDPSEVTWVVSDLKTKLDLQRRLMRSRDFLGGDALLRASELWRTLLTRLRPDIQLISKEFAVTLIGDNLGKRDLDWVHTPGAAATVYHYLCQLMPVFSHHQGPEMTGEWFAGHEASRVRWGRWYELSLDIWNSFLERGLVAAPWISGVLVNEFDFESVWHRPLIFDLGAELDQVEADLITILSNHIPITVLHPSPQWRSEYRRTLQAYELLERKTKGGQKPLKAAQASAFPENSIESDIVQDQNVQGQNVKAATHLKRGLNEGPREFRKFTTMLAEVKQAVATVRKWIESVPPRSIAVVAPDIEVYWSALEPYLQQEGIPCQKARVARLHTFPDMAHWMAKMRLQAGGHRESDVEVSLFASSHGSSVGSPAGSLTAPRNISHGISYETFRVLFSALYSREDLLRDEELTKMFSHELDSSDSLSRDQFVVWALKSLSENADRERVESLVKRMFQECPESTTLALRRWVTYFEEIATKQESRVRDGDPQGIGCLNLISAESSPATHMILLGLTESSLRQGFDTGILSADIQSLAYEFGFHLQSPDMAKLEFEARWVIEDDPRHLILSVAETDFEGAIQAPSWLWIRGAREHDQAEHVSVPEATRWDEMQTASFEWLSQHRDWSEVRGQQMQTAMAADMGEINLPLFAKESVKKISASRIKDFLRCPFIFSAKNIFGLSDQRTLDLDMDTSSRGQLLHAVFELLTREPMRFDWSDSELQQAADLAREQAGVAVYDERLWPTLRLRYAEIAKQFLRFESAWRMKFPATKTIAREAEVSGFIDLDSGQLMKIDAGPSPQRVSLSGSIDRIDVDDRGHAVIIDYKSTGGSLTQWTRWIENGELQLLLYALAFEQGLTKHDPMQVVSAVYYVARTMDREKGFKAIDIDQGLYETTDRKQNKLTLVDRDRLFAQACQLVTETLQRMRGGEFAPNPKDVRICQTCQWSTLCRAPHLNN